MGFFSGNKSGETTMKDCIKMVEKFFQKIGINAANNRLKDAETPAWMVVRGSAAVYISLHESDGGSSLRIFSPILFLPTENILPFYRRCLEINRELLSCALCVQDDKVAIVSQRPIEGLDPEELEGTVGYLAAVADELDNKLADEFGAKMCGEDLGKT
jgi:hypothetical protein